MNVPSHDRLYHLLPAIYQLRDAAEGEPLRALLAIVEQELRTVEDDITRLYDNWFIETCAPWVVPYIGDLLDVRDLYADNAFTYGQQERRAYVANTLAYRRRKGTTPVLEQLARDVTGWRSRAVEYSRLLLTTQQLNHIRATSATVNLRADSLLEQIGTPFEHQAAYTPEIRSARRGGRYALSHVGLFIWRLQNYPIERGTARPVAGADGEPTGRYYTFHPLGYDMPLFNQPQTETNIVNLAQEINVPGTLRCLALSNELRERQRLLLQGQPLDGVRYFDRDPVLQIFVNGQPNPIPSEEILICSLGEPASLDTAAADGEQGMSSGWRSPPYSLAPGETDLPLPTKVVAVDPELGRMAFLDRPLPRRVDVSYLYGFSDDLGGGPYPRQEADLAQPPAAPPSPEGDAAPLTIPPLFWTVDPTLSADPNPLASAILAWNQTTAAWRTLHHTGVPLATLHIPAVQVVQVNREPIPRFAPGQLGNGLQVIGRAGQRQVIVTAGRAIDAQGRQVVLREDTPVDLTAFDPAGLPNRTGILATGYQSAAQKHASSRPPIYLIPETALEGYGPGIFIPLARITLDAQSQLVGAPDAGVRFASFQPGIVQGLEVKVRAGTLEAIVTPGMAVDVQGRRLITIANQPLDLKPYQGETRLLILARDVGGNGRSRLELVRPDDLALNPRRLYVLLATLEIPRVTLTLQAESPLPQRLGSVLGTGSNPATTPIRVEVADPERAIVTVSAGTVFNAQHQPLTLEQGYAFDLSGYAARTLVLFLSPETGLGLPLSPVSPPDGHWQHLGIVPPEPDPSEAGVMLIGGNQSYGGDLVVAIPANRQLKLIAASGFRPHLQGNLYIQGMARDDEVPGAILLDGLFLEGHLTVLAGHLKHLQISHCTLVPELGGIRVRKGRVVSPQPVEDETPLLAIAMYFLSQIQFLIRQEWNGSGCAPSPQGVPHKSMQLVQFALQQLTHLVAEIWQTIQNWSCSEDPEVDTNGCWGADPAALKQDNPRLEITLDRTIAGPIYLADTVPRLAIANSLIDKGQGDATSGTAIAAPGTEVDIATSTVLGMSLVQSLEASNSLFTEKVTALRHQTGCVRFSHVPEGSQTPRRYQCQPDLAFRRELDTLPEGITALAITPGGMDQNSMQESNLTVSAIAHEPSPFLLLGTAGGGIFRYSLHSDDQGDDITHQWVDITHNLPDRHITAILAYHQSGIGLIRSEGTQVMGVTLPEAGGEDARVTTRFTQQLRPGDRLTVAHQTRTVTAVLNDSELSIDTPFAPELNHQSFQILTLLVGVPGGQVYRSRNGGETWVQTGLAQTNATLTAGLHTQQPGTGTLAGTGSTLTGTGTRFSAELQVGDTLTLSIPEQNSATGPAQTRQVVGLGQPGIGTLSSQGTTVTGHRADFATELKPGDTLTALGHTRTVVRPLPDQPSQVEIDAPFPLDLPVGTPFQINIDTVLQVNAPFSPTPFSQRPFQIHRLYVATAGGGVWRASEDGEQWQAMNDGLTGWNVRALAIHPQDGQLFAGTAGNGVFRWAKPDPQTQRGGDRWVSANSRGLTNRTITALVCDPDGYLVAGTAGGGVFYSPGEEPDWMAINQGLPSLNVTTLGIGPPGDGKTVPRLFMGTSDGQLFATPERGKPWGKLGLDFKGMDITALVLHPRTGALWVGTATGEVVRSRTQDQNWQSANQGLPNVTEKLQIIDRLKPAFTSTRYGDPGYGQLSQGCAQEIRIGAEDGSEMGVFHGLKQPQREANLQASLEEYLRFGLEAVMVYVS